MTLRLVLASASPRRRELLGLLGLLFEIVASRYDEALISPVGMAPPDYVTQLARGKAQEVAGRTAGDALIIGADTTVVLDGQYLNKPLDSADAVRMLRTLSGRTHQVYTGLALIHGTKVLTDFSMTEVTFAPLSDETIAAYVATGEPLDKAGAYGIQGKALSFIPSIQGDYFNVVGLPVFLLGQMLSEFAISVWSA
ncbi:MAG: Maf family protein [Janthinobacterium lividum]